MHSLGEALLDLWPKAGCPGYVVGRGPAPRVKSGVGEAVVSPAKEWKQRAKGISDARWLIAFSVLGWLLPANP